MAKQNGTLPKIDEDFMRELISQGVPAKQDKQPEDIPNPAGARVVRATTGKPTFRKWNWQTDNPCT